MTGYRCTGCLEHHSDSSECSMLRRQDWPVAERSTADDVNTALQERMHGWRMVCGQLLREMREAGLKPTAQTLSLFPEPFDP